MYVTPPLCSEMLANENELVAEMLDGNKVGDLFTLLLSLCKIFNTLDDMITRYYLESQPLPSSKCHHISFVTPLATY